MVARGRTVAEVRADLARLETAAKHLLAVDRLVGQCHVSVQMANANTAELVARSIINCNEWLRMFGDLPEDAG